MLSEHTWNLKTFAKLQEDFDIPETHIFYYTQTTSNWKGLQITPTKCFTKSFKEMILNNHSISTIYPHIQKLFIPSLDSSLLKA